MADWTDLLPQPGKGSGVPEFALKAQTDEAQRANDQSQALLYQAQAGKIAEQSAQERQFQIDAAKYSRNPTPQGVVDLTAKYPDKWQAITTPYRMMDDDARRSHISYMGQLHAALQNKDYGAAVNWMRQHREAQSAAGLDVSEDDYWIPRLSAGGPDADAAALTLKGALLPQIAAATGLDKFSGTYDTIAKADGGTTIRPGDIRLDSENRPVTAAPWMPKVFTMRDGDQTNAYEFDPGSPLNVGNGGGGTQGAPSAGPLTLATLKPLFSAQESGGSYTARNKQTGAMGRWQVMPDTAKALAGRLGLDWRPDKMLHDQPADREYQDKIGEAAISEAIDKSGGDPATAFGYYYSGTTDRSKWGPKTKGYIVDMMKRFRGGDASSPADAATPSDSRVKLLVAGRPRPGYRVMTPEEVAKYPKLDPNRAWQVGGDGKISPLGAAPKPAGGAPKSVGNVIAPILDKVARGLPLSGGEQQALTLYRSRGRTGGVAGGGYREGQTATGANGQKVIYRNGKWMPM